MPEYSGSSAIFCATTVVLIFSGPVENPTAPPSRIMDAPVTVSYTHLDVYKRQVCNGCGACIARCPGLAIFVVDMTYSDSEALVRLPFEFLPVPQAGQLAMGLNRSGKELGWFPVVKVVSGGKKNMTYTISLAVPKELAMEVRNIRVGGYQDGR